MSSSSNQPACPCPSKQFRETFLHISSIGRDSLISDTPNSYSITLSERIAGVRRIELVSLELPNTVFPINVSNNTLYMQITAAAMTLSPIITFVIPPGMYDTVTLPAALTTAFQTTLPALFLSVVPLLNTIAFIYDNTLDRLVIIHDPSATANISVKMVSGMYAIPEWIGFSGTSQDAYSTTQTYSTTGYKMFVPENSVDLSVANVAFLRISCIGANVIMNTMEVQNIHFPMFMNSHLTNVIARVQLNVPPSAIIFNSYSARDTCFYLQIPESYRPWNMYQIRVQWTDENGNILDFNGEDHSFMLRLMVEEESDL
jgi:hypothetical protein